MTLHHFPAMLLFALVVSLAFAFLSRQSYRERFRYAFWAFLAFILIAVGISWLMYFFSR